MAKNRYVDTKFWTDTYIVNRDPIEKLQFIYALTNQHTNISGIYEIAHRQIAFDTGIDKEMVEKIFQRFESDNKMFYKEGWLAIINFINYQKLNPKVISGIEDGLKKVPEVVMIGFQRLSRALNYSNINSNINYNSNSNSNLIELNQFYNPKNSDIKYPTQEEFTAYCQENGYTDINIQKCWHHYNANGWRQSNGLQITRWHSLPATWRENQKQFTPKGDEPKLSGEEYMRKLRANEL
jgi:hypothetical protein